MMTRSWHSAFLLLAAILAGGCGPSGDGGGGPPAVQDEFGTTAGGHEYKIYPLDKLPEASQVMPALDGGKIEITHPAGWKGLGRSKDYIVGLSKTTTGDPPRIIITAKDLPEQAIGTVTLENFDDFLKLVDDHVAGELLEGEKLVEDVRGLLLGDRPYARYVRNIAFSIRGKRVPGERQVLRTMVNNRLYTIELQTLPGRIRDTRNDAYSLAAHIKIDGAGSAPPPSPEGEPKPAPMPEPKPEPMP
jgi:hypothetical protein